MKKVVAKISFLAAAAFSLCVVSCAKKDTAQSLTDELINELKAMNQSLAEVKDKASAEKAAAKVDEVVKKINDVADRLSKLDVPSDEEKKKLKESMDKAKSEFKYDSSGLADIKDVNEKMAISKIITEAMTKYGKAMQKHQELFKKYFEPSAEDKKAA